MQSQSLSRGDGFTVREKIRPYQNFVNAFNPFLPTDTTQYFPSILSFNTANSMPEKSVDYQIPNNLKHYKVYSPNGIGLTNGFLSTQSHLQTKGNRWQISRPLNVYRQDGSSGMKLEKMFSFARWDEGRLYEKAEIFKTEALPEPKPVKASDAPRRIRKKGAGRKTANPGMETALIQWFTAYTNERSTLTRTLPETQGGHEPGQNA
jgi:hypothetical protein